MKRSTTKPLGRPSPSTRPSVIPLRNMCGARPQRTRLRDFSRSSRGIGGTYQHCGQEHLQRYLNEFDFCYSNRVKLGVHSRRAELAIKGAEGKRLTYRRLNTRRVSRGSLGRNFGLFGAFAFGLTAARVPHLFVRFER
jgi:hypothetical protein